MTVQTVRDSAADDERWFDVRSLSLTYRAGHHIPAHAHEWHQLVHGRSGVMRVTVEDRVWLVPPTRAIWVPAGVVHQFVVRGEVAFRTLYLAPDIDVSKGLTGLEVSPLLTELIDHIARIGMLDRRIAEHARLKAVLIDLLNAARPNDLSLPLPRDPRARRLADRLQADPADKTDLHRLAAGAGASLRTLQRCFSRETGLTLDAWRQRARLIASTVALASGVSVTEAAFGCGYSSPSAFIAAFGRLFDTTPGQFIGQPWSH
jgi:AraC-like DNA-binding protein/quercetin dioxygenase-like cupin family protein